MGNVISQSRIWKFVGVVSTIAGLVCFGLSPTYKISFGKLGIWGIIVYLLISAIMLCLVYFVKRIRVPETIQFVVQTIIFVASFFISVKLDELEPGKSNALSTISYGLFALMSLSTSRNSEVGFETGCTSSFLALFLGQIYKTNRKLLPFAVIIWLVLFVLRRCSQSSSPNGDRLQEVPLINTTLPATDNHEYLDLEGQDPLRVGQDSGESLISTIPQATRHPPSNNGGVSEESTLAETRSSFPSRRRHSPSNSGQVLEENISDGDNEQNDEQEEDSTSTLVADPSYSSEEDHVSSANQPQQLRRRRTTKSATVFPSSSIWEDVGEDRAYES